MIVMLRELNRERRIFDRTRIITEVWMRLVQHQYPAAVRILDYRGPRDETDRLARIPCRSSAMRAAQRLLSSLLSGCALN